ncbi:response regulator [Motiliproteus sediminis]|uniref:response regulator n=1 Tax=Motiliproteus sediminis TaxID=1468178 RepID=UPI001AEFAFB1|nr:response regulator [Motiliproteus sediminis]
MNTQSVTKTLVLLDDDANVLKALQRELTQQGCEIHTFTRPLDALNLLQHRPVDVILSDLCMPQMDGREFLRQAAALQPQAVLITLSGYLEEEQAQHPVSDASWRKLEKPWCSTELRNTIAEALALSA